MNMKMFRRSLPACVALALAGCANATDDTPNVLPEAGAVDDADTTLALPDVPRDGDAGGDGSDNGLPFPLDYRIGCLAITKLGDEASNFTGGSLSLIWEGDIASLSLNIIFAVLAVDVDAKTAEVRVLSGRGDDLAALCVEPTTQSGEIVGDVTLDAQTFEPSSEPMRCSQSPASPGSGYGDFHFQLAPDELIHIYAENAIGVPSNCTPDPDRLEAVPLHAAAASGTISADFTELSGRIEACMALSDVNQLCTCLGGCDPEVGQDTISDPSNPCAGCSVDSKPLSGFIGKLPTSQRCTDLLGEDAFDLEAEFSAGVLPNFPTLCE